jgi:hypothetical protein
MILAGLGSAEGLLAAIPAAGGSYRVAEGVLLLALFLLFAGHVQGRLRSRQGDGA